MVESFKYKSKIATAIAFIAMIIVSLGKDGLSQIVPEEYVWIIPVLVGVASWILAQKTEDHRVVVAEEMVHEEYATSDNENESVVVNLTLDGEDVIKEEDTVINEKESDVVDDGGA